MTTTLKHVEHVGICALIKNIHKFDYSTSTWSSDTSFDTTSRRSSVKTSSICGRKVNKKKKKKTTVICSLILYFIFQRKRQQWQFLNHLLGQLKHGLCCQTFCRRPVFRLLCKTKPRIKIDPNEETCCLSVNSQRFLDFILFFFKNRECMKGLCHISRERERERDGGGRGASTRNGFNRSERGAAEVTCNYKN